MNADPMKAPDSSGSARAKTVIIGTAAALIALTFTLFLTAGKGRAPVPEAYVPTRDTAGMV